MSRRNVTLLDLYLYEAEQMIRQLTVTTYVATEHSEQAALVAWAQARSGTVPELALLYAIPNGGQRHPAVARKLQAEGVKPGVPDLCLPVARDGFHALYLELKRPDGGRVSLQQLAWQRRLRAQGYRVEVCAGWDRARGVVCEYLGIEE